MDEQRWPNTDEACRTREILEDAGLLPDTGHIMEWERLTHHQRYCVLIHAAREHLRLGPGWEARFRPGDDCWYISYLANSSVNTPPGDWSTEAAALIAGLLAWEAQQPKAEPEADYRSLRLESLLRRWLNYKHFGMTAETATELARETYRELGAST